MNERILELADQAAEDVPGAHMNIPDEFCKKFAELIIKECALVIQKKVGPKSALNVLEHFGVEE